MFKFKNKKLARAAIVFFVLLFFAALIPALRNPVLNTLKYPLSLFTLVKREAGGIIFYHRNLLQHERLSKEIDLLKRKLNETNEIRLENARLKNLLSLKKNSPFKVIAAQVFGRSGDSWSSLVMINKGSHHGIKRGFVAINYLGLVGRVVETSSSSSKVMLLSDPNLGVSALITRSRQEGLVSGTLGSSLIMRYLPRDSDVQISDTVITSGLTSFYPKGLVIGTVTEVGDEFSGLSRYCLIKPVVDLSNIEEVLIIIP